ncbi:hypothetical protein [Enterobacter sp. 22466]|uniref:hypothetical protein n=1 Tax=Enterobacter sp. 22466 TaxID=3453924 RepID=UPI003F8778AF
MIIDDSTDIRLKAARKGWDLVIPVSWKRIDDIIDISREMKAGSTLTLVISNKIVKAEGGQYQEIVKRSSDSLTDKEVNRLIDGISNGIRVVLNY